MLVLILLAKRIIISKSLSIPRCLRCRCWDSVDGGWWCVSIVSQGESSSCHQLLLHADHSLTDWLHTHTHHATKPRTTTTTFFFNRLNTHMTGQSRMSLRVDTQMVDISFFPYRCTLPLTWLTSWKISYHDNTSADIYIYIYFLYLCLPESSCWCWLTRNFCWYHLYNLLIWNQYLGCVW